MSSRLMPPVAADPPRIELARGVLALCRAEADRCYPLETGGVLMGFWRRHLAVVTQVIGPGPNARHERWSFEPDQEWQLGAIAAHYARSGRRETYLGDWHTHPDARNGNLSRMDRGVLRKVISTPSARAPTPVMMILYGSPAGWVLTCSP